MHQAGPTSGRKPTRGSTEIQDGDKIPHKVNLSPLPSDDTVFGYQSPTYVSEDYSDSSGSDEGHDRDFLPPTEKPVVPEEDMANPQPERLTDIESATKGRPVQTTYNPDLVFEGPFIYKVVRGPGEFMGGIYFKNICLFGGQR